MTLTTQDDSEVETEGGTKKERNKFNHSLMIDAAFAAGQRALKAGMEAPLVCFADTPGRTDLGWTENDDYRRFVQVTLLGLLEATYEPIDVREHADRTEKPLKVFKKLGLVAQLQDDVDDILRQVSAIEMGRRVAKGHTTTDNPSHPGHQKY